MKNQFRALESFLELFLVLFGIVSYSYVFNHKEMGSIDSLVAFQILATLLGIVFGIFFVLLLILLSTRWTKKDRKIYVKEKIISMAIYLLILLILNNLRGSTIKDFLWWFSVLAVIFAVYLGVVFLFQIITSNTYTKWFKALLILFICIIFAFPIAFVCKVEPEYKKERTEQRMQRNAMLIDYE